MADYQLTQTGDEVQDILDNSQTGKYFYNQTVSSWTSDATYSDYPKKGLITLTGVKGTDGVEVTFSNADATSGNYAPICNTVANGVEIWAKAQDNALSIPTIHITTGADVQLSGSDSYLPISGGDITGSLSVVGSDVITEADCEYNFVISTGSLNASTGVRTNVGTLSLPAGINFINMSMVFANNSTGYRRVYLSTHSDVSDDIGAHALACAVPISGTDFPMNVNFIISLSTPYTYYIGVLQNSGSTLAVYPRVKVVTIKK